VNQDGLAYLPHKLLRQLTVKYLRDRTFTWADMKVIQDGRAIDDLTVAVELRRPHAPFLTDIAGAFPILPAHVWGKVGDPRKFVGKEAVIGSGPFRQVTVGS
jgi:peptide/nickel transport system substrate-binding protein